MSKLWRLLPEKELQFENQLIRLIETHKKMMFRLARLYTDTDQQALIVVQDAVYKAYMAKRQLKRAKNPKCWLLYHVLATGERFLSETSHVIRKDTLEESWQFDKNELGEAIASEIRSLPEKQRMVVFLRYFEDLKTEEIACILSINVELVKLTLYKALSNLDLELEEVMTYE